MATALYRRYRPESFADVIGQEHVTEPLMQALRTGRVNHAYLFSGPRGCGKTTSATQESHVPHGMGVGPCSQLRQRARMRALVVLPQPRGPLKR